MTEYSESMNIAIIGGTGALGAGLALRWARAGHNVSHRVARWRACTDRAAELSAQAGAKIAGHDNATAAAGGDLVVMAVPYASHAATLNSIKPHLEGKIYVDVTVPLMPPKVRTVQLPERRFGRQECAKGTGRNCSCCFCVSERRSGPFE